MIKIKILFLLVISAGLCHAQHFGDSDHPMNKDTDSPDTCTNAPYVKVN